MWTEAIILTSESCQMCNSWTFSTPSICNINTPTDVQVFNFIFFVGGGGGEGRGGDQQDILLDIIQGNPAGDTLKEDQGSTLDKGQSTRKDDCRDDQTDDRVGIVPPTKVRQPNEQCRRNDPHIPQRIPQNMQKHPPHIQILVRMSPFLLRLGFRMIMFIMRNR